MLSLCSRRRCVSGITQYRQCLRSDGRAAGPAFASYVCFRDALAPLECD